MVYTRDLVVRNEHQGPPRDLVGENLYLEIPRNERIYVVTTVDEETLSPRSSDKARPNFYVAAYVLLWYGIHDALPL